ncbi:VWA domain-containing protein [Paenibacillus sp. BR1-192]|uniref:VWA domain-containing protein n=1 Tax=Paenibacillus sp. BR1-192 TaxID=3032287 RepID=UPI00240DE787|nr:VWA domain-containing protein [Paenibacillus sp. BR1-192]WFB61453.1 VWA domain-containing protein [Paenibacillus sp. BR1-192]
MITEEWKSAASAYPFSAILGQEKAKRAVLLYLVNPAIGGILVNGHPGSGKSVLLHAASSLVKPRRILSVPVNVTADRLLGALDMAAAMNSGKLALAPGLLEEANGQLLLVDHMNLLSEAILKEIVSTLSTGSIYVQREGISTVRRSRFMLLAAMDPNEGRVSPPLLDHFGYCVTLDDVHDSISRAEIIRRNLQFEHDPFAFQNRYLPQDETLRLRVEASAQALPQVQVSADMIQLSASIAREAGISSSRGDLSLIEGAKAAAAWDGRSAVTAADIREIADFVLPHRMTHVMGKPSASSSGLPEQDNSKQPEHSLEDHACSSPMPPQKSPEPKRNPHHPSNASSDRQDVTSHTVEQHADDRQHVSEGLEERVLLPDETFTMKPLQLEGKRKIEHEGSGKRNKSRANQKKGRAMGYMYPGRNLRTDVALDATIRAAAPYQTIRTKQDEVAFAIEFDDLRQKKRENRVGATLLFVVDASGSMAARKRMTAVKGAILSLLQDAYEKRDRIGMIAFRNNEAELILPVTRSIEAASKQLRDIPTGGKTPLADGLAQAYKVLQSEKRRNNDTLPVMIMVTDGRANESSIGLTAYADIWNECLEAAKLIRAAGIRSLVLDTEQGFVKLGRSRELADALGAEYRLLDHVDDEGIARAVRTTMK